MNLLRRLLGEMETPRLVLRHWRESDLEDFLAFAADPAVMLDSGARPATTFEEEQAFFRRALWDSGCYAIVLKETGRPIGKIKFQKDIRRPKGNSLSIGYELARAYWGRGYMTEALAAMVRCAFERKHVDVLAIGHFQGNHRSRRVSQLSQLIQGGFHILILRAYADQKDLFLLFLIFIEICQDRSPFLSLE